jgi:hypothetical protein
VPWDQQHRAELLSLKSSAESLALAGKWQESYDTYQRILTVVGDHEVSDPVALSAVNAVLPGQDRAIAAMLADAKARQSDAETSRVVAVQTPAPVVPFASLHDGTIFSSDPPPATGPVVAAAIASPKPAVAPVPGPPLDAAEIAADTAPPLPGAPPQPIEHAHTLPDALSDQQIGQAIQRGVNYLGGQFAGGELQMPLQMAVANGPASLPGYDALAVYALLNAGRAMDVPGLGDKDPFTMAIIDRLKRYNLIYTYHRSLRAAALAVFHRLEDTAALEADVAWLEQASMDGAYTYTMTQMHMLPRKAPPSAAGVKPGTSTDLDNGPSDLDTPASGLPAANNQAGAVQPRGPGPRRPIRMSGNWDNSNSQYGLFGVWSGAQANIAVPLSYWKEIESHWDGCANPDGSWPYQTGPGGTFTMTCAGIASLLVATDYLESTDNPRNLIPPPTNATTTILDGGLDQMDKSFSGVPSVVGARQGYALYGMERVGLASGYKYFGTHDWYAEMAKAVIAQQQPNGSWGSIVDTSYCLMFLARGRHPILYNKLRYDGSWNDRRHDVSHLARFAAAQLERPINWQVVNLRRNWFDWMDSPVLYISGYHAPSLTEADYNTLRDFTFGGGLIFTHADANSEEFNKWVSELVRKIYPRYELVKVPHNHPIYSTVYPIKDPPPLLMVSNGSRLLLVHSPTDISGGWQLDWTDTKQPAFQLGVNLFVYAAGKGNLKNRLASPYIPEDPAPASDLCQIARLRYAGEWDPEPYAWTRFSRYFQWETRRGIRPMTVALRSLKPGSVPLAVLTGTVRQDFTAAEQIAAREYVQAGGVLMIDACGGQADFIRSVQETLMPQAFPGVHLTPIEPNHPLLLPSRLFADDLTHMQLRGYAKENGGKDLPMEALAYGKGWVIFSRLDLTTGLLGTQSWGILGYDPAYAEALMKNAVLWAEARSPVTPSTRP